MSNSSNKKKQKPKNLKVDEFDETGKDESFWGKFSGIKKLLLFGIPLVFFLIGLFFLASFLASEGRNRSEKAVAPVLDVNIPQQSVNRDIIVSEGNVKCPVCGNVMQPNASEYKHFDKESGETLYFDTEKCYKEFLENPDRYLRQRYSVKVKVQMDASPSPSSSPTYGGGGSVPDVDFPSGSGDAPSPEVVSDEPDEIQAKIEPPKDSKSSGATHEIPEGALPASKKSANVSSGGGSSELGSLKKIHSNSSAGYSVDYYKAPINSNPLPSRPQVTLPPTGIEGSGSVSNSSQGGYSAPTKAPSSSQSTKPMPAIFTPYSGSASGGGQSGVNPVVSPTPAPPKVNVPSPPTAPWGM